MSFDHFLDLFHDDLVEIWTNSTHYITTDFGKFLDIKYDAFIRKGKI
jgi:hypothetical protein